VDLKLGNQYIIPFRGLKDGEHKFEFDFDKLFFEKHEVLEARDGVIKAEALLYKKPQLLTLSISIAGFIQVQCDRCLDYFNLPIAYDCRLIIKFSENIAESTDEIWIIHPSENEIDLEQYFFECIGLSIPLQKIHPLNKDGRSGCNSDMLSIIEEHLSATDKDAEEIDPRWNKLKDLLNDNNNLN
jgi:uncharacterized protein